MAAITTAINGVLPTLTARRKWRMGRGRNDRCEAPLGRGSERSRRGASVRMAQSGRLAARVLASGYLGADGAAVGVGLA
jgi:hypothetical protein